MGTDIKHGMLINSLDSLKRGTSKVTLKYLNGNRTSHNMNYKTVQKVLNC